MWFQVYMHKFGCLLCAPLQCLQQQGRSSQLQVVHGDIWHLSLWVHQAAHERQSSIDLASLFTV